MEGTRALALTAGESVNSAAALVGVSIIPHHAPGSVSTSALHLPAWNPLEGVVHVARPLPGRDAVNSVAALVVVSIPRHQASASILVLLPPRLKPPDILSQVGPGRPPDQSVLLPQLCVEPRTGVASQPPDLLLPGDLSVIH